MIDPYSTHMEFLLKHCAGAESILELGCGKYSTPLFLNRSLFPQMKRLVSVENDQEWADRIASDHVDPRFNLIVNPTPVADFLSLLNLTDYDLIFVDNASMKERISAIEYLARNIFTSRVVIHDFEIQEYRDAAKPFTHMLVDWFRTPSTGMVWK